ncbi:ABC transporter ATP-binding protein [Filimonas effusa]|uniref:ABC transporter ATP-binding protein n=1 Tax=Filimonas effusa TaxID=2508721 RepID=A0A4V1M9U8_9BACT|nr:ABC transporter ATP-binding protein [Filimonas effusa]RXK82924.1 ABC transporter ATP-binding protein [Filimonas effusa]
MINIRDLNFSYRRKQVFNKLNLSLEAGHIYGLLGGNGMGKSTLLRNIAGLLFPDSGSITVNGHTPGLRKPSFLRELFMIPEEFFIPNITIDQYVKSNAPFYPHFDAEQLKKYLRDFEIPLGNKLQDMSYGQRKKALISFGLACNTPLLLMDEPTNGLDIVSKSQFRKVMAGVADAGRCIVISTHQVKDLENLIDGIVVVEDGRILFHQTIESISGKLVFRISFDAADTEHAIYAEESFKGNALILANTFKEETAIDLELLYKAIIFKHTALAALFEPTHSPTLKTTDHV